MFPTSQIQPQLSLCLSLLFSTCWAVFLLGVSLVSLQSREKPRGCAGCNGKIRDRFMLQALDRYWHEDCLKCACCDCRLGRVGSTLYTRANLILCRRDYLRYGCHRWRGTQEKDNVHITFIYKGFGIFDTNVPRRNVVVIRGQVQNFLYIEET